MAAQSMMAEAGMGGLVVTEEKGTPVIGSVSSDTVTSIATCPAGTQLIGGDEEIRVTNFVQAPFSWDVDKQASFLTNQYIVSVDVGQGVQGTDSVEITAIAFCGQLTFPMNMGMVGGELLDINTVSLLVGAIGTNPVITALVGITIAGVAGQAVWFVHRRKKK